MKISEPSSVQHHHPLPHLVLALFLSVQLVNIIFKNLRKTKDNLSTGYTRSIIYSLNCILSLLNFLSVYKYILAQVIN